MLSFKAFMNSPYLELDIDWKSRVHWNFAGLWGHIIFMIDFQDILQLGTSRGELVLKFSFLLN